MNEHTPGHTPDPDARTPEQIAKEALETDWHVHTEPEPDGAEGESVAWTADPTVHLSDIEAHIPEVVEVSAPLPVCDIDSEEPCEDPVVQKRFGSGAVVAAATVGAVVGGLFVAVAVLWAVGLFPGSRPLVPVRNTSVETTARPDAITINATGNMAEVSEAVAAKVVPSVVNITMGQKTTDPFTGQTVTRELGNGSGVIIRSDGYILTNYHVIEGADEIIVTVGVNDEIATVVGVDPSSDLAVLKIEGENYPAIETGSSKGLSVGQYVMAVGSPFGLEKTVTVGIISALQRSALADTQDSISTYTNLIQTDAAINPGNSGGALVDAMGRLVGINTLIQTTSGSSAGIGFAIPIDFAVDIAEQLITTGRATHPYIGVSTETVDESVASRFGLPVRSGALVRFVQPNSPAEQAGIRSGDIIVAIEGQDVTGVEDVFAIVRDHKVGDTLTVEVVRDDTRASIDVVLGSDAER